MIENPAELLLSLCRRLEGVLGCRVSLGVGLYDFCKVVHNKRQVACPAWRFYRVWHSNDKCVLIWPPSLPGKYSPAISLVLYLNSKSSIALWWLHLKRAIRPENSSSSSSSSSSPLAGVAGETFDFKNQREHWFVINFHHFHIHSSTKVHHGFSFSFFLSFIFRIHWNAAAWRNVQFQRFHGKFWRHTTNCSYTSFLLLLLLLPLPLSFFLSFVIRTRWPLYGRSNCTSSHRSF